MSGPPTGPFSSDPGHLIARRHTIQNDSPQAGMELLRMLRSFAAKTHIGHRKVVIGVCTMDKKAQSKPMQTMLARLNAYGEFDIVVFGNTCLLEEPIEKWPTCDCLISFFSSGFPFDKAVKYLELRKPFLLNDLKFQENLLERHKVYEILAKNRIPTPRHVVYKHVRDFPGSESTINEQEDYVEVNGTRINKPFVEKPLDAEDHNIYIYYPKSAGGGSKRLFRKRGNKSSEFYPDINTLRDGSFIYEEFLATEGTDVKVYTVGADYAHAEARKSPVLDGVVKRDTSGKEIRYPVILTPQEKEMARSVVLAFKQRVCGFDLLRTSAGSYVCDVNGWSFVKNSKGYDEDAAQIMRVIMLKAVAPTHLNRSSISVQVPHPDRVLTSGMIDDKTPAPPGEFPSENRASRSSSPGSEEELRCVVAVVRHGDRTPKQKLKMIVEGRLFLSLFDKYAKNKNSARENLKLKSAPMLQEILNVTRQMLERYQSDTEFMDDPMDSDSRAEKIDRLMQMKSVLEKGGHFSGVNRKVQLKPMQWRNVPRAQRDADSLATQAGRDQLTSSLAKSGTTFSPPNNQTKPKSGSNPPTRTSSFIFQPAKTSSVHGGSTESSKRSSTSSQFSDDGVSNDDMEEVTQALLILKWGGELTHTGRKQAQELGSRLLTDMYPAEDAILQLHSTYRHDLKIYASDEGRVEMTAAAYAKGLLNLEGELTPILVSLVQQTDKLLERMSLAADPAFGVQQEPWEQTKAVIQNIMHSDTDVNEQIFKQGAPTGIAPLINALKKIGNPRQALKRVYQLIQDLTREIEATWDPDARNALQLCEGELLSSMLERWRKLEREFYRKGLFDIRKVPDVYDCIKYDYFHNQDQLNLETSAKLYEAVQPLNSFVNPQEYGLTATDKLQFGIEVCKPLMKKILYDLQLARNQGQGETVHRLDSRYANGIDDPNRHVRTRLYFTSESHILTLLNIMRYADLNPNDPTANRGLITSLTETYLDQTSEFNYLTHIVFRLFENVEVEASNPKRFRVELLLSPGVSTDINDVDLKTHISPVRPPGLLNSYMTLKDMENILQTVCS